ncbi:MAG: hypothetical protein ACR2KC_04945 [Acidimicrobiales bacterium]
MVPKDKVRIGLEAGRNWVFASALDWPGWCRRGKGEEAAIDTLLEYARRYAEALAVTVPTTGRVEVIGRRLGGSNIDFGAPGASGPWDDEPLPAKEADRLVGLLDACWRRFDIVVDGAPGTLRKGPRGGGRDRGAIVDHVREAERAYGSRIGTRVPPRTPWEEQRRIIAAGLRTRVPDARWPARYGIRRVAWHVLDHAWEIEDRSN